jgi:hypothetical protein
MYGIIWYSIEEEIENCIVSMLQNISVLSRVKLWRFRVSY